MPTHSRRSQPTRTGPKLAAKSAWLRSRGYDLTGKDAAFISNLFALYQQPRARRRTRSAPSREWQQWRGTNRPHHSG